MSSNNEAKHAKFSTESLNNWQDTLMCSMKQELFDLNTLIFEMEAVFDCGSLKSWLFPTKTCKDVITSNADITSYTKMLECILDKTYILFNIFLKKLEGITPQWSKNIRRPIKLSISGLARVLLEKLDEFIEFEGRKPNSQANRFSPRDRSSQTEDNENCSSCSSCDYSVKCLKTIAAPLETSLETSKIRTAKSRIKEQIFQITQFGSTKIICDAAVDDINELVNKMKKYKANFDKANHNYESTLAELDIFKRKCIFLEDNYKLKSEEWAKERKMVLGKIELLEESNESLENDLKVEIEKLDKCYVKLNEEVSKNDASKLRIENVTKKNNILHKDNSELCITINDAIAQLLNLIDMFNIKCAHLQEKTENLYKKLFSIKQDIFQKVSKRIKYMNETIDIQNNEILKYRPPFTDCEECSNVKGNPLPDMLNQIRLNKLHMRRLGEENESLMKTVKRLKEFDGGR